MVNSFWFAGFALIVTTQKARVMCVCEMRYFAPIPPEKIEKQIPDKQLSLIKNKLFFVLNILEN